MLGPCAPSHGSAWANPAALAPSFSFSSCGPYCLPLGGFVAPLGPRAINPRLERTVSQGASRKPKPPVWLLPACPPLPLTVFPITVI